LQPAGIATNASDEAVAEGRRVSHCGRSSAPQECTTTFAAGELTDETPRDQTWGFWYCTVVFTVASLRRPEHRLLWGVLVCSFILKAALLVPAHNVFPMNDSVDFVQVVLSTLSVWLVYMLGATLFDSRTGLTAAALFA
jgi:hypothetical protein